MNEIKDKDKPFKDIEFVSLKFVFKAILIILFIVLSLLLVFSVKTVAISDDVDYTFENEVLFSSDNMTYWNSFNLRNIQTYSGHYNATYSFENIPNGTSGTDIDFVDWENLLATDGQLYVKDNFENHDNVIYAEHGLAWTYWKNNFIPQTIGTIELWVNSLQDDIKWYIVLAGNSTWGELKFDSSGLIVWYNGSSTYLNSYESNTWYHLRIDFNTITDSFDLYINGILCLDNGLFLGDLDSIQLLQFSAHNLPDVMYYIDAIGYSWIDNYTIGQNIIPLRNNISSIEQVDKYEWRFKEREVFFVEGEDNPLGWSDIEIGGGDEVNTIDGDTGVHYNGIHVFCEGIEDIRGIEKDDFTSIDTILNISIEWKDIGSTDTMAYTRLIVKSSDTSEVINIGIRNDGNLYYDSTILMADIETSYSTFYFNIFLHYEIDLTILRFYINDTYINTFQFPLSTLNKSGLSEISFTTSTASVDFENLLLWYIGIYGNGTSLCTNDFGWNEINMYIYEWNNNHYPFLNVNATGNFGLYTCSGSYETGFPPLIPIYNFTGVNEYFYEIRYDYGMAYTPFLLIHLEGNQTFVVFNSIHVEGCILTEGITKYNLDFTHTNINISNNYFYVENNRLYFYIDLNESNYEGMCASFDINNTFSTNASIRFKAKYNGNLAPYTILSYKYNPNSYYSLSYYSKSHNYLLPQNQEITHISINVSDYIPLKDNYTNHETGFISGYITNIQFIFYPNIQYSITVMTLIYGFIPLIVMLVPTFALYSKFGRKIVLPSLIFMSIICLVSQLIPVWLFSMLMIIFGYLILINRNSEVD